jgi:hypothetical protein
MAEAAANEHATLLIAWTVSVGRYAWRQFVLRIREGRGSRFQRRQDSGDTVVQRRMGVIESPRSVAACTDIGEYLPMLVDVGTG